MPKSPQEKINFARRLLEQGIPYTEIQSQLKTRYGSGMSNTSLRNLNEGVDTFQDLRKRLEITEIELRETKIELTLYKKMYQELLEVVKEKIRA